METDKMTCQQAMDMVKIGSLDVIKKLDEKINNKVLCFSRTHSGIEHNNIENHTWQLDDGWFHCRWEEGSSPEFESTLFKDQFKKQ
jgi:hypothetical protein